MARRYEVTNRKVWKTTTTLQTEFHELYVRFVQLDRKSDCMIAVSQRAVSASKRLLARVSESGPGI